MVLTSFLILILLVIIYLLIIPIILFIDTNTNQYYIQLKGFAKASIESRKIEFLRVKLNILFMTFYFYPIQYKQSKKKNLNEKKLTHKRFSNFKRIMRLLKSFKVKKFLINIDTGDPILNAKLYPIFSLLNISKGNFNVNFKNINQLTLHLENRPIDIIKSYINLKK